MHCTVCSDCQEAQAAFTSEASQHSYEKLLLTAAVAAGKDKIDAGYDVPTLAR